MIYLMVQFPVTLSDP